MKAKCFSLRFAVKSPHMVSQWSVHDFYQLLSRGAQGGYLEGRSDKFRIINNKNNRIKIKALAKNI